MRGRIVDAADRRAEPVDDENRPPDASAGEIGVPEHLARLPGGPWCVWRWVGLRSAGFPLEALDGLTHGEGGAADRYLAAEEVLAVHWDRAIERLEASQAEGNTASRPALVRSLRQLRRGLLPDVSSLTDEAARETVLGLRRSQLEAETALTEYQQHVPLAIAQAAGALRRAALDSRFREALVWQNRTALGSGIASFLRADDSGSRSSRQRQNEGLVLSYLQRYCTKNDTIGFFGPVGWARVVDGGAALRVRQGSGLLARRTVYFDGWAIDALARVLAGDEALLPWLPPRRLPHVDVRDGLLYVPLVPPRPLDPVRAAVLQACDGVRPARELAAALVADNRWGFQQEDDVYAVLKELRAERRIEWTLEVSVEGLHPERQLRRRLELVGDAAARRRTLAALDRLEAARQRVEAASGEEAALNQAMRLLEEEFTELTGQVSTRRAGQPYAGRALIYEDCLRDVQVEIGDACLRSLGPPLSLVLTSARWFASAVARAYRGAFQAIYRDVAAHAGSPVVEFSAFWFRAHPLLFGPSVEVLDEVVADLHRRWASVLQLDYDQQRVEFTSAELVRRVQAAFSGPPARWAAARYHSPDLMLDAPDLDAIAKGEYQWVLGELHSGVNTLKSALFAGQHPNVGELLRATEIDLPEPQVVVVGARAATGITPRLSWALTTPKDFRFVFAPDSCDVPPARALAMGALTLVEKDETLTVRTRDQSVSVDIVDVLGDFLSLQIQHRFSLFPPADHLPRVTIDKVVVQRETWCFDAEAIEFARLPSEAERYIGARHWMRWHGMPRWVFVSCPGDKPIFVDFDSILSVQLLARSIRRMAGRDSGQGRLAITEMLPDVTHAWLTDGEGRRYTAEFRLVAVT